MRLTDLVVDPWRDIFGPSKEEGDAEKAGREAVIKALGASRKKKKKKKKRVK